jgi:N-methylhydantoinase A/oxoprolinase/acetone carboxylase beta subunit
MNSIYLGIDVGGTHTDGVAVDVAAGRLLHKVKVLTTTDLRECSLEALEELLEVVAPGDVGRVVLSTTLVTNAIAAGQLEPTGLILTAGPGANPDCLATGGHAAIVPGAMDHRGREIFALDEDDVRRQLERMSLKGVQVIAVASKFGVRNPAHEKKIAEMAEPLFDHVSLAHRLSGALNFPRRAATAYLAAGVWRRHTSFIEAMADSVKKHGIDAPLYLLRADGGAHLASSFDNPAETALSGPAASIMGAEAMEDVGRETLSLDIGGTTTDIALFVNNAPLLEPHGATIGDYRTQIRSLYNRSIPAGGDSVVDVVEGELRIGPRRAGPAAAFGGPRPTPTDALVVLGRATGDREKATAALAPLAEQLGMSVDQLGVATLKQVSRVIAEAVEDFVTEVNTRPVYTIHELLEGHKVSPERAVVVGGPARALAPYLEAELELPIDVANHFDVANAVGAAVARTNLEVNALADTAEGLLSIPEAGIHREVGRDFSLEQTHEEALEALTRLAHLKGLAEGKIVADVAEQESFRIVEGYSNVGSVHRLRMQIRPSILCRVE